MFLIYEVMVVQGGRYTALPFEAALLGLILIGCSVPSEV